MKLTKLLFFCFFFEVFCAYNCFAQYSHSIKDSADSCSGTLPPDQLKLTPQSCKFKSHKEGFNFSITNNYCYIVVKLQSDTLLHDYVVCIKNTSLDSLLIYHLDSAGTKQLLYAGGNYVTYNPERAYVWHTAPVRIDIQPSYYLIAIKDQSKNVNVEYDVMSATTLQHLYQSFDRIIFFYLGIICLIMIASLIGLLLFKNKALFIFPCYIVAESGWILAHYGYLYPNLCTLYLPLCQVMKPLSFLISAFFLLWLLTNLFKELSGTLYFKLLYFFKRLNILFGSIAVLTLLSRLPLFLVTAYNIAWNFVILFSDCLIIIILAVLSKKNKTARLFFIAIGVLLIMALFQLFANIGFFQESFLTDHGILMATTFEVLMLTYGIFYRIWQDQKLKDKQLLVLEAEQTKALEMLIQVQDNERKRIAEDLHDSIGPMLAAIKINFLRVVKSKVEGSTSENLVTKTEKIIEDSITEIRNVSHQLMPKNLSSKGLITVLDEYFRDLQEVYGTPIQFTHNIATSLDKEVQLNIYRIVSELVLNAAKHSGAKGVSVSITTTLYQITIMVQDNGKGFNPALKRGVSLGLKNVASRVAYMKGNFSIESTNGKGTTVSITIPNIEML